MYIRFFYPIIVCYENICFETRKLIDFKIKIMNRIFFFCDTI